LWNYAEPDQQVPSKTFTLDLHGMKAKRYRTQLVDPKHGSALEIWQQMGSPVSPTLEQIATLRQRSQLEKPNEESIKTPIVVPPQGLVLLTVPKN
jgi:xylan 1,4-beta-xylosidase